MTNMKEHHINIKDPIVTHPNLVQSINEEVFGKFEPLPCEFCIYKVHMGLRNIRPEAYTPMLVSIGPYHKADPNLQAMQKHKLHCLHELLERREEKNVERYILELKKLEDRARKCYADPIDLNTSDEFVKMMLLDGCFIIEFCRQNFTSCSIKNDDTIFKTGWMTWQICRDMMLLENQLPFFVLSLLYDMTKDPGETTTFSKMAMKCFNDMLPRPSPNIIDVGGEQIKHLLHAIHIRCCPQPSDNDEILEQNRNLNEERTTQNYGSDEISDQMHPLLENPPSSEHNNMLSQIHSAVHDSDEISGQMHPLPENPPSSEHNNMFGRIHSAAELQEAGVKFEKVGNVDSSDWLFDIEFKNGLMKVPCFRVDDYTDTFFRNLIAYEQHSWDVNPKYFTDYVRFMDQLIDSERDVKLLHRKEIIVNLLGEDKAVSEIFNKLGSGLIISPSTDIYSNVRKNLIKHCASPWNEIMATFWGEYFNGPWKGIATVAAVVLLLLALLQTIAAFVAL